MSAASTPFVICDERFRSYQTYLIDLLKSLALPVGLLGVTLVLDVVVGGMNDGLFSLRRRLHE